MASRKHFDGCNASELFQKLNTRFSKILVITMLRYQIFSYGQRKFKFFLGRLQKAREDSQYEASIFYGTVLLAGFVLDLSRCSQCAASPSPSSTHNTTALRLV
jgi:hypothetical protein